MKIGVRAAMAVMFLLGFYALGIALLALVLGLDVLMLHGHAPIFGLFFGVPLSILAFFAVGRVFRVSVSLPGRGIDGVAVLESEQPALWSMVRRAAASAGTAAPDYLWIDSRFNAGVFEQARWLGLRSGPRHLVIGAPMLVALSPAKLDVVLAHEFGHFAHGDTRLLPVIMRGRATLAAAMGTARFFTTDTVTNGRWLLYTQHLVLRLIHAYAVRFLTVTQSMSRAQEYAADRISARLCGRDTAACAIAEMPAYQAAYRHYREHFADAAAHVGLVPDAEKLFPGFDCMLAEPRWQDKIEAQRRTPSPNAPADRFDSHPPIAERVSALRALPDDGRATDGSSSRMIDFLDGSASLLAAVASREMHRADRRPVDWDTLADAVGRESARKAASCLIEALLLIERKTPALEDFFDHVEAGHMETLLQRLLTPAQARYVLPGAAALEIGTRALASSLPAWIMMELAAVGRISWRHSWSEMAVRDIEHAPEGLDETLADLLGAAPAQAASAAADLRVILRKAGVDV